MKLIVKSILFVAIGTIYASSILTGCSTSSQLVSQKSGAQLWGENCMRCHNTPSPDSFDDDEWNVISNHMQLRAHITDQETKKILEFLQSAN